MTSGKRGVTDVKSGVGSTRLFVTCHWSLVIVSVTLGLIPAPPLCKGAPQGVTLLNVSYDPTRELYRDINKAFSDQWKAKTGQAVTINQSHGGSGKQARAVIDG